MYYIYLIRSKIKDRFYIGYTNDLKRRLKEHGVKLSDLVYYEAYKAKEDAMKRELRLKRFKSAYGQLKKRIIKSRI